MINNFLSFLSAFQFLHTDTAAIRPATALTPGFFSIVHGAQEFLCSVSLSLPFRELFSLLQAAFCEDEIQGIPEMVWVSLDNLAAPGGSTACSQAAVQGSPVTSSLG